jgi:putative membrane protein
MNLIERTGLALLLLIYISGVVGMCILPQLFIPYTPAVIWIFAVYFIYVHRHVAHGFFYACVGIGVLSFAVEALGVNTGLVFGQYHYGTAFGAAIKGVPLGIGINWVLVLCASWGICSFWKMPPIRHCAISAACCTFIDMLMEPLAPHFNWWFFSEGYAGFYNYLCWYVWSFTLGLIFKSPLLHIKRSFAIQWMLLNGMYFLILNVKRFLI